MTALERKLIRDLKFVLGSFDSDPEYSCLSCNSDMLGDMLDPKSLLCKNKKCHRYKIRQFLKKLECENRQSKRKPVLQLAVGSKVYIGGVEAGEVIAAEEPLKICSSCNSLYYDNCPLCFGYGVKIEGAKITPIQAGKVAEYKELDDFDDKKFMCPHCKSTPLGMPAEV